MASFRVVFTTALKIKNRVQVLVKQEPKIWNAKGWYETFNTLDSDGFCLKVHHAGQVLSIAFAKDGENRIVVYSGTCTFSSPGNVPDKSANKQTFVIADIDGAANYIYKLVKDFLVDL